MKRTIPISENKKHSIKERQMLNKFENFVFATKTKILERIRKKKKTLII